VLTLETIEPIAYPTAVGFFRKLVADMDLRSQGRPRRPKFNARKDLRESKSFSLLLLTEGVFGVYFKS
jgi:hypothetical protein